MRRDAERHATRAKATQENGNEKRLLISVRLALRSRLFALFN